MHFSAAGRGSRPVARSQKPAGDKVDGWGGDALPASRKFA
jgi:hypothetical protein